MHRIVWVTLALAAIGCGTPPNHRLLVTRTDDYNKAMAFGFDTGHPFDIAELERKFPELKGIVITAAQWVDEFEEAREIARAQGDTVYTYPIPYGANVTVEVVGEDRLTKTYTIPPSGSIDYPYIGKIQAAGLTTDELRTHLTQQLRRYLKKPEVLIHLNAIPHYTTSPDGKQTISQSFGGQQIIIMGISKGTFEPTGNDTLVAILANQGLPGSAEWRQIRVIRRDQRDPLHKARVIVCDMWDYLAKADMRQNIPLLPGDTVYVPMRWSTDDQWWVEWSNIQKYIGLPGQIKSTAQQIPLSAFQPNNE